MAGPAIQPVVTTCDGLAQLEPARKVREPSTRHPDVDVVVDLVVVVDLDGDGGVDLVGGR